MDTRKILFLPEAQACHHEPTLKTNKSMVLLGEYIRIQKYLKNIAMLTNGQNVFIEIPKTSLWESVTLLVLFWLVFDFSYFNQCFFPSLMMLFASLPMSHEINLNTLWDI